MANEVLCLFNKFGYCRYLETCRKKHTKDICDIPQCEVNICSKRHPRTCRYYEEYGRCKFGDDCSYKHNKSETNSEIGKELEKVKDKIRLLESIVEKKEEEIKRLLENVKSLEARYSHQCKETFHSETVEQHFQEKIDIIICDTNQRIVAQAENFQKSFEQNKDYIQKVSHTICYNYCTTY